MKRNDKPLDAYYSHRLNSLVYRIFQILSASYTSKVTKDRIFLLLEDWLEEERNQSRLFVKNVCSTKAYLHLSIEDYRLLYYLNRNFPPFVIAVLMEIKPNVLYARIHRLRKKTKK